MTPAYPAKAGRRWAFTLVELLVVIGIIGLLVAMLMPVLSKVRRQANLTKCAANLHNIGLTLGIYAANNKGKLPQFDAHPTATNPNPKPGAWLWDIPSVMRDALVASGTSRANLYCPVHEDVQNADWLWDYEDSTPLSIAKGSSLTPNPDGSVSGFAVMGYFFLTLRVDNSYSNVTPALWDSPDTDPKFTVKTWRYQKTHVPNNRGTNPPKGKDASTTEIVTDATADDGAGNFGNFYGGYNLPHQSAHWFGKLPIGGNILFLDGHVGNRGFNAKSIPGPDEDLTDREIMHLRCTSGGVRFYF